MVADALALTGFALVCVGLWWIWPPLALIVGGIAVCASGVAWHYNK